VLIAPRCSTAQHGRLKLFGAVLSAMQIDRHGRIAIVYVDHEMARAAGGTYETPKGSSTAADGEGEIQAVVFFNAGGRRRVPRQPRSKAQSDVGRWPREFGGGGHKKGRLHRDGAVETLQKLFVKKIEGAIDSQDGRIAELPQLEKSPDANSARQFHGRPLNHRQAFRSDLA